MASTIISNLFLPWNWSIYYSAQGIAKCTKFPNIPFFLVICYGKVDLWGKFDTSASRRRPLTASLNPLDHPPISCTLSNEYGSIRLMSSRAKSLAYYSSPKWARLWIRSDSLAEGLASRT